MRCHSGKQGTRCSSRGRTSKPTNMKKYRRFISGRAPVIAGFAAILFLSMGPIGTRDEKSSAHGGLQGDLIVYDDSLRPPWIDASSNTQVTYGSTEEIRSGTTSIKVVLTSPWGILSMHHGEWQSAGIDPNAYSQVEFDIYAPTSETSVSLFFENDQGQSFPKINTGTPVEDTWVTVSVLMSQLNPNRQTIHRICLQEFSGTTKTFYIDNLRFIGTSSSGAPQPPALLLPEDGAANISNNPTFHWKASLRAETYRLQVSTSEVFSTTVIDQSGITDTTVSAGGLLHGSKYYWRVNAQSGAGPSGWSQVRSFTTAPALLPPPSLASPPDGAINQDTALVLRWNAVPAADSYRLQVSTTSTFESSLIDEQLIPAPSMAMRGLSANTQYYWRVNARNSVGISGWSATWSFTTARPESSGVLLLRTTIPFPERSRPSEYSERDYRIVGLPGASNAPIRELLPGDERKDWSAYWDNGAPTDYLVPYNGGADFQFRPGRAFWIIKTSSWRIDTTVRSCALNEAREAEIALHAGWNLITSPFLNSVPWSAVQALESTNELIYKFENGTFLPSVTLEPFVGYYFFNGAGLDTLRIPLDSNAARMNVSLVGTRTGHGRWRGAITTKSGSVVDQSLWFGVEEGARSGWDPRDIRKPQRSGSIVQSCFRRPEWDSRYTTFAADIRPPGHGVERWDFEVSAPPELPVELSVGIGDIPATMDVFLLDRATKTFVNLRNQSTYLFWPATRRTALTLLVGEGNDLQSQLNDLGAPARFWLGTNYPNPFNPSTTIPFELAEESFVEVTVHDLLGRSIKRLVSGPMHAGMHDVSWDGSDVNGIPVPSGTYLLTLKAGNEPILVRKLSLIR